jgi:ABC-type lipoprotein release transport system permease subunit
MLISQKRKEIGLLMSIGLSKARIQKLFLILGLLLAGSGLFLGLASGVLVSQLLHIYPIEILPDIYYDTVLPSVINYDTVLYVFIFCCVMAFFAAFVPVKQLVIRQPADNLRQTEG